MKKTIKKRDFAVILKRVLPLYCQQLDTLECTHPANFIIRLKNVKPFAENIQQLDRHIGHLYGEFGDPDLYYRFQIYQGTLLESELCYGEKQPLYPYALGFQSS